jgi:hypothetical protein
MKYKKWVTPEETAYNCPLDIRVKPKSRTLPKEIGPHEIKELNLMLMGAKPAALISSFDLKRFKPYINDGTLACKILNRDWVLLALKNEEWRISRIEKIRDAFWHSHTSRAFSYHVKLGRILGYSKDQINFFLVRSGVK